MAMATIKQARDGVAGAGIQLPGPGQPPSTDDWFIAAII